MKRPKYRIADVLTAVLLVVGLSIGYGCSILEPFLAGVLCRLLILDPSSTACRLLDPGREFKDLWCVVVDPQFDASGNPTDSLLLRTGLARECEFSPQIPSGICSPISLPCRGECEAEGIYRTNTRTDDSCINPLSGETGPCCSIFPCSVGCCSDGEAPLIFCPEDITVPCESYDGTPVSFSVPVSDDCDPNPTVTCDPPSGSEFDIGTTVVSCTVIDASGKSARCFFFVTVDGDAGCGEGMTSSEGRPLISHQLLIGGDEPSAGTEGVLAAGSDSAASSAGSFPPHTIVLTPTGDATLIQQSVLTDDGPVIQTSGPWLTTIPTLEGAPSVDMGGSVRYDLLRFGLVTGGVRSLEGRVANSDIRTIGPTDLGLVAAMTFDLASVKAFLDSAGLTPADVRASLRVTPLRTLAVEEYVTDLSPVSPARSSTAVALLDMPSAPIQDPLISFFNFPGFPDLTSPARSSLDELEQATAQAPMDRTASLPIGSSGNLSPLSFDVSATIQRELQGEIPEASVGFILASELNATGVVFADSSWDVPGTEDILAPHLVLELPDFTPPRQPQFVVSTTRIPFNWLRIESRDLLLVTVSNLGSRAGKVMVEPSETGSDSFALMPAPGADLNLDDTGSASIPAGGHLTFGVAFQPTEAGSEPETQMLRILDRTRIFPRVVSQIQLEGLGVPDETGGVPAIVAPITPSSEFLPQVSAANLMTKAAGMLWLLGIFIGGVLTLTRARSNRRRARSKE